MLLQLELTRVLTIRTRIMIPANTNYLWNHKLPTMQIYDWSYMYFIWLTLNVRGPSFFLV